jgi:Tol biopolymer transport system component
MIGVLILFRSAYTHITGAARRDQAKIKDNIEYISFSSDGRKILFDRTKGKEPCMINVYDLENNELCAYQSPSSEKWSMARYSPDGKHIVLCITPRNGELLQPGKTQIAVMDPDGRNVRAITNSSHQKVHPTFSQSGDRVIFGKRNDDPNNPASFDIYEVDMNSGKEMRLTWFNMFCPLSPAFELPDRETILFSAYGMPGLPSELKGKDNSYMVKKGDKVSPHPFVIPDKNNPLLDDRNNTKKPLISKDGTLIVFQGVALRPNSKYADADQFFKYSKTGIYQRMTYLPASTIWSADLSYDGKYLAVVVQLLHDRTETKKIALCSLDEGTYRMIDLPDYPVRIINQPSDKTSEKSN